MHKRVHNLHTSLVDLENLTGCLLKITELWHVMPLVYPEDGGNISLRMIVKFLRGFESIHACVNYNHECILLVPAVA